MAYSQKLEVGKTRIKSDTIASGTTTAEIDLEGGTLVGLFTPASLSSTSITITAADVSGGTFVTVSDKDNTDYTITVDSNAGYYYIDPTITAGLKYIKFVCGSSETSKELKAVVRNLD